MTDTLRLIKLIQKFHNRKFVYRLLYEVVKRLPWLNKDWDFWTKMNVQIAQKKSVFLLFIHAKIDFDLLEERINASLSDHEDIGKYFHLITFDSSFQIPGCVVNLD